SRLVHVGDRIISMNQTRPYEGWHNFRQHIFKLIEVVKSTKLIEKIERYSLKCINLIEAAPGRQLSLLNAKFELANRPASEEGFQFRTEFAAKPYQSIIQLGAHATVMLKSGDSHAGLLVEVDTIRMSSVDGILDETYDRLDQLHQIVKPLFFDLLTLE